MSTCDFCLVPLAAELNSDYCIDCYRAFVPEIKIRILQQAFPMSWKDMEFGCAKQYDDETMQIQLIGPGNEYWTMPNWIIEFWCKKPGCKNGHMGGGIPKGTPLSAVVEKCKSSHTECDTSPESDSEETSVSLTTVVTNPGVEEVGVKSSKPKTSDTNKKRSKSASSLESSKAGKKKKGSEGKKKGFANKKILRSAKNRAAAASDDDPFAL